MKTVVGTLLNTMVIACIARFKQVVCLSKAHSRTLKQCLQPCSSILLIFILFPAVVVRAQQQPSIREKPKIENSKSVTPSSFALVQQIRLVRSCDRAANLLPQPSVTTTNSSSQLDYIVQADTPASQPSETYPKSVPSDRWQLSVEPYFFAPFNVRADITAFGRSASVHAGLGDFLNLDRARTAGLRFEARKNRFGLIFDGFYLSASQSGNFGVTFPLESLQPFGINRDVKVNTDSSVSIDQGRIDLMAFYRVFDKSLASSATASNLYPRLVIDPMLGLRTNIWNQEIDVARVSIGDRLIIPFSQKFSVSRTTFEPLIGGRIGLDLSRQWSVGIRGDISGFNINAERDTTWNILFGTRYRLSPSTSLQLAYNFNGFDFEDGTGLRRTKVNLRQNGLWLSALFQF